jgi:hypothetical protein
MFKLVAHAKDNVMLIRKHWFVILVECITGRLKLMTECFGLLLLFLFGLAFSDDNLY